MVVSEIVVRFLIRDQLVVAVVDNEWVGSVMGAGDVELVQLCHAGTKF